MKKRLLLAMVVLTGIFLLSASIVFAQPAPVAKTGQTDTYRYADDGYYQKGVASPTPRFIYNDDYTATDTLTGLTWIIIANVSNALSWIDALDFVNTLSFGNAGCGATYNDWRMPNVREMLSVIDYGHMYPALTPTNLPFVISLEHMASPIVWTSTTYRVFGDLKWTVRLDIGNLQEGDTVGDVDTYHVMPVRGGN